MANIAWVVQRREIVSQVLVDSIQKIGNANSLRLQEFKRNEDPVFECSIAVQTSPIHSPKASTSSPNSSVNSPSTTQEYDTFVPLLDIEALQKRSEGCQSMGLACRLVCINCGNPVSEPLTASGRDEISVLSAKTSDLSISRLTKPNDTCKKPDFEKGQSDYILKNLGLNSNEREAKSHTFHQSKNGNTSVISICLADPEEFSKEEKEMENTSEDSLERMVMPPLNLVQPPKESKPPLAENNNVMSLEFSDGSSLPKTPTTSGNSDPRETWSDKRDCIKYPIIPIHDHRPRQVSTSTQSDSKDSKERRRSFGFNLKHTADDMSSSMPRMYLKKRKRKESSNTLGRFWSFLGIRKKKKRGPGHFNKLFDG